MAFSIKNWEGIEDAIKQVTAKSKYGSKVISVGNGEEKVTLTAAGRFNSRITDERMGPKDRGNKRRGKE